MRLSKLHTCLSSMCEALSFTSGERKRNKMSYCTPVAWVLRRLGQEGGKF